MLFGGVAVLDNKVRVSTEDGHLLTKHVARSRLQGMVVSMFNLICTNLVVCSVIHIVKHGILLKRNHMIIVIPNCSLGFFSPADHFYENICSALCIHHENIDEKPRVGHHVQPHRAY